MSQSAARFCGDPSISRDSGLEIISKKDNMSISRSSPDKLHVIVGAAEAASDGEALGSGEGMMVESVGMLDAVMKVGREVVNVSVGTADPTSVGTEVSTGAAVGMICSDGTGVGGSTGASVGDGGLSVGVTGGVGGSTGASVGDGGLSVGVTGAGVSIGARVSTGAGVLTGDTVGASTGAGLSLGE